MYDIKQTEEMYENMSFMLHHPPIEHLLPAAVNTMTVNSDRMSGTIFPNGRMPVGDVVK